MKKLFAIISVLLVLMIIPFAVGASDGAVATRADVNLDGEVTKDDAIYLLMYTFFPDDYPIENKNVDYNGDGTITKDDAIYLLMYTFFPEDYPIEDDNEKIFNIDSFDFIYPNAEAKVTASEDCSLLVRFIEEDIYFSDDFPLNKKYIDDGALFATAEVIAGSEAEYITAEIVGEPPMEPKFVVEAVLVDGDGNELSSAVYNANFSQRYWSFMSVTGDDFEADDKVIELDTGEGLAVLADDVKMITAESVEQEISDDGSEILYHITAPSEDIKAGDKVYITAPNLTGGAVFRVNETETNALAAELTVKSVMAAEGASEISDFYEYLRLYKTYLIGLNPQGSEWTAPDGFEPNAVLPLDEISKELGEDVTLSAQVSGTVVLNVKCEYAPKLLGSDIYSCGLTVDTDIDTLLKLEAEFEGDESKESDRLSKHIGTKLPLPIGLGLYVYVDTSFDVSWNIGGSVTANLNSKTHNELVYTKTSGFTHSGRLPELTPSLEDCDGSVELDFGPTASVGMGIAAGILELETDLHTGILVEGEAIGKLCDAEQAKEDKHHCDICIDGDVSVVVNVDAQANTCISEEPLWNKNVFNDKEPIFDFYASVLCTEDVPDFKRLGEGDCPNKDGKLEYKVNDDGVTCTITGIGTYGYYDLVIPETIDGYTVTAIGEFAFEFTNIKRVDIPQSVTSIGVGAFYFCENLLGIEIPASVTSIGRYTFSYCFSLEQFVVNENNEVYHSDNNCLIETKSKTLISGCKNSIIPSDGSVTSIGYAAFQGCRGLTNMVIPESVTSIENFVFDDCRDLTSINIPNGITSIGAATFQGCNSLTNINIPNSVTSIGEFAFSACPFTSIEIPNSVRSIGKNAFQGCEFTSINIPSSVTYIGKEAFRSCHIESVKILVGVTVGPEAFGSGCEIYYTGKIIQARAFIQDYQKYAFIYCTDGYISNGNFYYYK